RSGFRTFVLCAAPRRDILLGKNLSTAPLALVLSLFMIALIQVVAPMRVDHLLATLPQMVSMYLLFSLLGNLLSIYAPMPIASGSLKPVNPKAINILLAFLGMFLFPVFLAPTLLPLGIELLLAERAPRLPVCLILSVVIAVAIVFLYRLVLTWQGSLLQAR